MLSFHLVHSIIWMCIFAAAAAVLGLCADLMALGV